MESFHSNNIIDKRRLTTNNLCHQHNEDHRNYGSSDSEDDFQPKQWNDLFLDLYGGKVSLGLIIEKIIRSNISTTRIVFILLSNLPPYLQSNIDDELYILEHMIDNNYRKPILSQQEHQFVDVVLKLENKSVRNS